MQVLFLILHANVLFPCVGTVYVNKDCTEVTEAKELVCFTRADDRDTSDTNLPLDFKASVLTVDNKVRDSMKLVKEGEIRTWKDV